MKVEYLNPEFYPNRNNFDISHELKTTVDMGYLTPILTLETMPGDTIRIKPEVMARLMPMVSPVMHRIKITMDFFWVPNRILWKNWQKWVVGTHVGEHPYIQFSVDNNSPVSLVSYMGIPQATSAQLNTAKLSAFPLWGYWKIYDEYYRDQNLLAEVVPDVPLLDGANTVPVGASVIPAFRAWQHDYFTSALPWAQKGDPVAAEVTLNNQNQQNVVRTSTGLPLASNVGLGSAAISGNLFETSIGNYPMNLDPNGSLEILVKELRFAFALQSYLEKNARGGTRYVEWMKQHFGVDTSDGRAQRPEFMGRVTQDIVISEVLSTAETTEVVGALAGHGISYAAGEDVYQYCEEHGYVHGIINVQPNTSYGQGLPRHYTRRTNLEYPIPVFANLGEQEIRNYEIFGELSALNDNGTFAYQPMYQELRDQYNRYGGHFYGELLTWHLGRKFAVAPSFNSSFIGAGTNVSKRIFAVTTEFTQDTVLLSLYFDITRRSAIPKYGIPQLTV